MAAVADDPTVRDICEMVTAGWSETEAMGLTRAQRQGRIRHYNAIQERMQAEAEADR